MIHLHLDNDFSYDDEYLVTDQEYINTFNDNVEWTSEEVIYLYRVALSLGLVVDQSCVMLDAQSVSGTNIYRRHINTYKCTCQLINMAKTYSMLSANEPYAGLTFEDYVQKML